MMNFGHVVVVFAKDKSPRILHVTDIRGYKGRPDCLINPKFPEGIPPHRWTLKDGAIKVVGERTPIALHPLPNHPQVVLARRLSAIEACFLVLASSVITYLLTH